MQGQTNRGDTELMTKTVFYCVMILLLITACSDQSDDKPYIRKPMKIIIQKNAAWDGFIKTDETATACKEFVLTTQDVNEFFQVARLDTEHEYSQGQVMSRCYAEGELTLPRKYKGKWRIDRARRGILMVEGAQTYFFYCESCTGRQYVERK